MTMHTIWLREHNRVAKKLVDLLPGRSDEFYFQQARRIVIAQLQHITYTKYLPLIIGATLAKKVNSNRNTNGNVYFGSQTESDDPSIFTEFNTAAFRFGHSQIKNMIKCILLFTFRGFLYTKLYCLMYHSVYTRLMGD